VSAAKLVMTVAFSWLGLRQFGLIGALGGWILAEEMCRMVILHRTAQLFHRSMFRVLPRELWFQIAGAAIAVVPGVLMLHFSRGPVLARLFETGMVFGLSYLAALRAMGILPPLRQWLPQKPPMVAPVAPPPAPSVAA